MDIIDIHCHLWAQDWLPARWWQALAEVMAEMSQQELKPMSLEEAREELLPNFWDPQGEKLMETMDRAGIQFSVISALDFGLCLGEARVPIQEVNWLYSQVAKAHHPRLIPFMSVDLRRNGALSLVDEAITQWSMKGLKLHPCTGFYPNSEEFYPIYQKAQEHNIPILTHTGPIIAPLRSKYAQPIYLDDILVDFPHLKVIAAHSGFCWWLEAAHLCANHPNLYMDLAGWQMAALRDYAFFCITLRQMLDIAGPEKILFGTDEPGYGPLISVEKWIEMIKVLPHKAPHGLRFSEQEVEGILGLNAKRLLGLI